MKYENLVKTKDRLCGYEDQKILMDMLSSKIEEIAHEPHGTLNVFTQQALQDALEKRSTFFKKIKDFSTAEKSKFVKEIVINTAKRAKLITSIDEIVPACSKVYQEWRKKYRPDEIMHS